MALYRNIHISFWSDTKVADGFTPEDKYFMLYCLTNSYTNLIGCYEISIRQMSNDLGYDRDTISKLLDRFQNVHKVIKYNGENKELFILNWYKYNWTSSDKLEKSLIKEIDKIKTKEFKEEIIKIYNSRDTISIPYPYPIDTTDIVTDSINNNNNNIYNNNIYDYITSNFGILINGTNYNNIKDWLDYYDEDILIYAVDKCVSSGVRTLNYMYGILNNWKGCNYKTLQDIKDNEKKAKNNNLPIWFDKEIQKSEATEEDKNMMEDLLREYKYGKNRK